MKNCFIARGIQKTPSQHCHHRASKGNKAVTRKSPQSGAAPSEKPNYKTNNHE
jgi:hypothetical protein